MAVLPVAFATWVALTQPAAAAFLMTPSGLACLVAGLALEAIGIRWMVAILREAV
jgi:Flp pilus assembly protein TadB